MPDFRDRAEVTAFCCSGLTAATQTLRSGEAPVAEAIRLYLDQSNAFFQMIAHGPPENLYSACSYQRPGSIDAPAFEHMPSLAPLEGTAWDRSFCSMLAGKLG